MKKVLKNTLKTRKYLDKLPKKELVVRDDYEGDFVALDEQTYKVYLIACWASYGILEFPFTGKYIKENGIDIPLVYDYDDHNGTCDCWWLRKITNTTTGRKLVWTQDAAAARRISDKMNE